MCAVTNNSNVFGSDVDGAPSALILCFSSVFSPAVDLWTLASNFIHQ